MDRLDVLLWLAIQEDLGHGDVTTRAVIEPDLVGQAFVIGREPFVLSGSRPFERVFQLLDPAVEMEAYFRDGDKIQTGIPVFKLQGPVQTLLTGERTALNLLQRLCGVATLTRQMVEALSGTSCRLLDTRKTTPLWRGLEKEAVCHGGGANHRFGLYDGVLIKDNHIAAAGGVRKAIERARGRVPHTLKIEAEVESLDELEEALEAGADIVLLDNFPLDLLKEAVARTRGRSLLEASGGVNLDTVRAFAETGVDFVSCGALTHSAKAIDISLEITPE
jgi:nicotinate-nucleotide pyrophosphorylase (carboxylating)